MKKLLVLVLALLLSLPVLAHSGRTDSDGGHYDRFTGEYHYHHGYSAHQHEGGQCPYDFDDRTGESSGSSSSSEEDKNKPDEKEHPLSVLLKVLFFPVFIALVFFSPLLFFVIGVFLQEFVVAAIDFLESIWESIKKFLKKHFHKKK